MSATEPVTVESLHDFTEPLWCVYCTRQAYYSVEQMRRFHGQQMVCGRHLLKAVRDMTGLDTR